MGLFDGRFIGPNDKDNYGSRTFTTAYDYLVLGNNLLSMLVNFGFTADKIYFIPGKNIPNHHPYQLGCISHYAINQTKHHVDSIYNRTIGKNVAVEEPYTSMVPRLQIDSSQVQADLAGFYIKKKVENKKVYDTIIFPQIEGTGSWKDANNFDLVYEWLDLFFVSQCDSLDITKRQFSKYTPKEIQECILQRFDTKKYLEQNNITENEIKYKLKDRYSNDIFDMVHFANEEVLRTGKYELFRYFNDVYWRDVNETSVIKGKELDESGEQINYSFIWSPGDGKNPVWHCAFQYDKDQEINPKSHLINFVMLPYGTKGRKMPTVVPNDLKHFSQFEGVVIWKEGSRKQIYSNKDDIWINTLNGRMINRSFNIYPNETGILPLNDDGTVDCIYKIYVWKDDKEYWAYIYCGLHAGVRGGKPGKSFVDQVQSFRSNYIFSDYWYFYKDIKFKEEVVNNMPVFIDKVESLEKKAAGIDGKTKLKIHIPISIKNEKNPKKTKTEEYYLLLNSENTGVLFPDKINFAWRIDVADEFRNNMLVKIKTLVIIIGGEEVAIQNFEEYLNSSKFTPSEIRRANKEYAIYVENSKVEDTTVNLNEIYNNSIYNLSNSDETDKLIAIIKEDLSAVRYEIPKAERTLIEWQDKNSEKMGELEKKLDELTKSKKTRSDLYEKTKDEFEKLKLAEDKKLFQYNKLVAKEDVLIGLLEKCNERLGINLDNDLLQIQSRINFLEGEKKKYEAQLKKLKSDKKSPVEHIEQVQVSIDNKKQELEEAQIKKAQIQRLIQNHKRMQSVEP